ncbi:MAG: helix-turn-helix transcriptional regulator [Thermoanaerobacteraceae bacterium]|nr:helix-turn-helix transcriptional regulator [Thermoanaerobacteraceae bacterium]
MYIRVPEEVRNIQVEHKYGSEEYWAGLIKMSLSRFFILHVLHRQPVHGYEITKQVGAITHGCCAPTEGSLYPVLKEFTEAGLVEMTTELVSGRERKVYTLTPAGERAYRVASRAWGEVAEYILQAVKSGNPPNGGFLMKEDG